MRIFEKYCAFLGQKRGLSNFFTKTSKTVSEKTNSISNCKHDITALLYEGGSDLENVDFLLGSSRKLEARRPPPQARRKGIGGLGYMSERPS